MGLESKQPETARNRFMLVLPDELEAESVGRAASIASAFDAELHVYCPVVVPPIPVTAVTPDMTTIDSHEEFARARGRRRASVAMGLLAARVREVRAETRVCTSLTTGIDAAVRRIRPNMLLMPRQPAATGLADDPYTAEISRIVAGTNITTWLMGPARTASDNVIGVLQSDLRRADVNAAGEAAAGFATRLAALFDSDAHLLCRVANSETLRMAEATLALSAMQVVEHKKSQLANLARSIAQRHGIPQENVHLTADDEDVALRRLIEPLRAGVVVTQLRSTHGPGGPRSRRCLPLSSDESCDVLILGDADEIDS